MTDEIDRYLDGAPVDGTLTPDARAKAETIRQAVDETRAFTTARPAPDLTDSVMRQIEEHGLRPAKLTAGSRLARVDTSLWAARDISLTVRPAYGLTAAAALVLLVVYAPSRQPA